MLGCSSYLLFVPRIETGTTIGHWIHGTFIIPSTLGTFIKIRFISPTWPRQRINRIINNKCSSRWSLNQLISYGNVWMSGQFLLFSFGDHSIKEHFRNPLIIIRLMDGPLNSGEQERYQKVPRGEVQQTNDQWVTSARFPVT